jgi:hypothetical protein
MKQLNRFDDFSRAVAMPIPRRKAFRYAALGLASAAQAFLFPERALAAKACMDVSDCLSGGSCRNDAACDGKNSGQACGNRKTCQTICQSSGNSNYVCCQCKA